MAERSLVAAAVLALAVTPAATKTPPPLAPVVDTATAPPTGPDASPMPGNGPPRAATPGGAEPLAAVPPPVAGPRTRADRYWPTAGPMVAGLRDAAAPFAGPLVRIAAKPGASVHAPERGRVVFADRLPRVGLVLIIAHGDEYHSVLAGLGALHVAVDDDVGAGQEIGRMATGPGGEVQLHLELHENGRLIDPLPWLGVRVAGDRHS